jgi:hypothetical protein
MIVELEDPVSSQDGNVLAEYTKARSFPHPLESGKPSRSVTKKVMGETDVCHGSTKRNLIQTLAIPKGCPLQETMLQSQHTAIRGRYYDFSMDQADGANFRYPSATYCLSDNPSQIFLSAMARSG